MWIGRVSNPSAYGLLARIMPAAFSPIMVLRGVCVADVIDGMMEASATLRLSDAMDAQSRINDGHRVDPHLACADASDRRTVR